MNKLRVFQNVKNNGAVSIFGLQNVGTVLLLLFLLPYLITLLFGNLWRGEKTKEEELIERLEMGNYFVINQTDLGQDTIPLELYVADKLERTMGEAFLKEARKAQAILIRTNLLQQGKTEIVIQDKEYGKHVVTAENLEAVTETKGMYLAYEKKPVYGAYFAVSNGFTRDAKEVLENEEYPYLKSVLCQKDILAEDYTTTKSCLLYEWEKKWERIPQTQITMEDKEKAKSFSQELKMQCIRDEAGYIKALQYRGKWVTGENFRQEFHLASSDIGIQIKKEEILFTTKGKGHGFGMSQFSANEMAKEGKNCLEILSAFFQSSFVDKME